jgi:fido (protein-threonine AMPylation protein)
VADYTEQQIDAHAWLISKGEKQDPLKITDVTGFHARMFPHGGTTRQSTAVLLNIPVETTPPHRIVSELQALVAEINELLTGKWCWRKAADVHLRLVYCQPFSDGNKRVARAVLHYMCAYAKIGFIKHECDKYSQALKQGCLEKYFENCSVVKLYRH